MGEREETVLIMADRGPTHRLFDILFNLKIAVFWAIALMMETTSALETSVNFYQTTRRQQPRRQPSSYSPP
jgi:hypothetical protein